MKRIFLGTTLACALALGGCNTQKTDTSAGGGAELKTDEQKTLYALGLSIGRSIGVFKLTAAELDIVKRGMTDQVQNKKPIVELQQWGPKINEMARARMTKEADVEKERGKKALEDAAKEQGAEKLASGLVFKTIKPGAGASPTAADTVKVHYHGTLTNGEVFDSSVQRGEPAEFPLGGVIPCWTEGVQKMKVGEKAKLTCPSAIAYGDRGSPPKIPGGATLVFEVELLDIKKADAPPPGMQMPGGGMPPGHPPTGMPQGHPPTGATDPHGHPAK
jgi:FKBP-type peptidyl-prolyl cis-trans isomerase FkpA